MRNMTPELPPEKERQFDLIAVATEETLRWARRMGISLEHVEPMVPFLPTDFSLHVWLFFDNENRVDRYKSDGTADDVIAQFRSNLASADYPSDWLALVTFRFASKEIVDRDYQGNFYYFLR